jgi:diguanylate cyclase (GGDEF)-like protein
MGLTRDEYAAMPPWGFSGDYAPGERAERAARLKELGSMVFRSSRTQNGEVRTTEVHARYVEGNEDDEPVIVAVTHDVTDQIRAEEILKHQAFHDALTGLANRALFEDRLSLAIAGAQRHGHILGIAYIDVDEFKTVNDRFGHDVGDRVLVALGERIERSVRQIDTAARFGGDEFVVLFPELSSDEDLERVIRKLGARLCEPVMTNGVSLVVTASIGSALFDTANDDARSLIMRADIAMYEAKRVRAAERDRAR